MAVHLRRNRALREAKQEPASPHVREYFQPSTKDEPQWQSKPEIPSAEEVLGSDTPDGFVVLTPNLIDQPWPSREKYLECHYKLLREDSVAPLRDAVAMVRNDPTRTDGKDFSVYESVSFSSLDHY
jgi:helicase required for RNAi-mediated heterochromatin assembly 1